jgi:hypothetical protein
LHSEEREDAEYRIVECAGCGGISFAIASGNEPNILFDAYDEEREEYLQYYPSPLSRRRPAWSLVDLWAGEPTGELAPLADEIYKAVAGQQYRLALMGVRALLEQAMILKVGDHARFDRNLDAFFEKGFISKVQREATEKILDAGHASTHRMYTPTEGDLDTVLTIAEGIFESIFVHGDAARSFSDRVPKRRTAKILDLRQRRREPENDTPQ